VISPGQESHVRIHSGFTAWRSRLAKLRQRSASGIPMLKLLAGIPLSSPGNLLNFEYGNDRVVLKAKYSPAALWIFNSRNRLGIYLRGCLPCQFGVFRETLHAIYSEIWRGPLNPSTQCQPRHTSSLCSYVLQLLLQRGTSKAVFRNSWVSNYTPSYSSSRSRGVFNLNLGSFTGSFKLRQLRFGKVLVPRY
jgi:hypothetical protein